MGNYSETKRFCINWVALGSLLPQWIQLAQLQHPPIDQDFVWTYSVYGDVYEVLPDDMPEPLGEAVVTTTTMDANLLHCLATGKSLTGCLHFVNETPVDWYSNEQATVETATYG